MATKPNTQPEGTPCVANEPKVEYQTESKYILTPYVMESLRRSEEDYKAGRTYTQEEVDEMLEKWLRPHTMDKIHAIYEEALTDDEADRLLSSDFVHEEMGRLNPWLK